MAPYPTMSTVRSASAGRVAGAHTWASCARTNPGTPRSDASISVMASSAVEASWMPRPLHRVTPSGTWGRMCSTPAVWVCTTSSEVIRAMTSLSTGEKSYGGT